MGRLPHGPCLRAANPADPRESTELGFGYALDLHGDGLVVGAPVRGNWGGVTWFTYAGGQWHEQASVGDPEIDGNVGAFGFSAALGDEGLFVSDHRSNQYGTTAGLVYVYPLDAFPTPVEAAAPASDAHLSAAYPNPFTSRSQLVLTLERSEQVHVAMYDLLGREVAVLHDGTSQAGSSPLYVEADGLPAGVYFIRAQGETVEETRRVTVSR